MIGRKKAREAEKVPRQPFFKDELVFGHITARISVRYVIVGVVLVLSILIWGGFQLLGLLDQLHTTQTQNHNSRVADEKLLNAELAQAQKELVAVQQEATANKAANIELACTTVSFFNTKPGDSPFIDYLRDKYQCSPYDPKRPGGGPPTPTPTPSAAPKPSPTPSPSASAPTPKALGPVPGRTSPRPSPTPKPQPAPTPTPLPTPTSLVTSLLGALCPLLGTLGLCSRP